MDTTAQGFHSLLREIEKSLKNVSVKLFPFVLYDPPYNLIFSIQVDNAKDTVDSERVGVYG